MTLTEKIKKLYSEKIALEAKIKRLERKLNKWIKVEERLPKETMQANGVAFTHVLAYGPIISPTECEFSNGTFKPIWMNFNEAPEVVITHWMKIPKPYK